MKIAIVGSRDYTNYDEFFERVNYALRTHWDKQSGEWDDNLCIISGGARGTDTLAEEFSASLIAKCIVIKPEWEKHGKAAGFIRNSKIAEQCDEMIAFWDGVSRGTEDSIKKAVRLGKQVTIFGIKEEHSD